MTLQEAVEKNICRLRFPYWISQTVYLRINIFDGKHGPWMKLFDLKDDIKPEQIPWTDDGCDEWQEYTGELDPADKDPIFESVS